MMAKKGINKITSKQRAHLAKSITKPKMKSIALMHFDLDDETIENLDEANKDDVEGFNREILKRWEHKNFGTNQVKDLARVLYEAAGSGGYVDPHRVCGILGISKQELEESSDEEDDGEEQSIQQVQQLREDLIQHTLKTIKPEMAPWAKGYTPHMDQIKTELTMTMLQGKVKRKRMTVEYKDLFSSGGESQVLVKGGIGTGKTLLCKKIAYDWAKGIFTKFYLVFVIFVDMIDSFGTVEDAIVQQYCTVGNKEQILRSILYALGNRCLVLFDGVHDGLSHLLRKISWEKFNILVTSRHFDDSNIESKFGTVCEICGFTQDDAKSLILKDNNRAKEILDIKPVMPPAFCTLPKYNPMMVMFLCVLDNQLDDRLSELFTHTQKLGLGEIYLKLALHLCKEKIDTFWKNMKALSKKVFNKLQFGRNWTYGKDEASLLVDAGLMVSCAGGSVMFVHTTFESFMGALYFILMLNETEHTGEFLELGCKEPIFLKSPLFMYFCLSLLKDQCLSIKKDIQQHLKEYILKELNLFQFDFKDIAELYPSLNYADAHKQKDEMILAFLNEVLSTCQKTKVLLINHDFPVHQMVAAMGPLFSNLTSLIFVDPNELIDAEVFHDYISEHDGSQLNVVLNNQPDDCRENLIKLFQDKNRKISLLFSGGETNKPIQELSSFMKDNVTKLHLQQAQAQRAWFESFLEVRDNLPSCQNLTHISLTSHLLRIDEKLFSGLSKAVQEGNLPSLTHLSFAGLGYKLSGKLPLLFKTKWPTLTDLNLSHCQLHKDNVQIVFGPTNSSGDNLLPSLSSLAVCPDYVAKCDDDNLFTRPWTSLTTLKMNDESSGQMPMFMNAVKNGIFPNLTVLKLSKSELGQSMLELIGSKLQLDSFALCVRRDEDLKCLADKTFVRQLRHFDVTFDRLSQGLYYLFRDEFSNLQSLKLRGCNLRDADVRILAQINLQNYLPKLEQLDISANRETTAKYLPAFGSKWKLKGISVDWASQKSEMNLQHLVSMAESDCLGPLETLNFNDHSSRHTLTQMLQLIADAVEEECFPYLKRICLYTTNESNEGTSQRQRIRRRNVSLYFINYNY